jgi:hypothetical protein
VRGRVPLVARFLLQELAAVLAHGRIVARGSGGRLVPTPSRGAVGPALTASRQTLRAARRVPAGEGA